MICLTQRPSQIFFLNHIQKKKTFFKKRRIEQKNEKEAF